MPDTSKTSLFVSKQEAKFIHRIRTLGRKRSYPITLIIGDNGPESWIIGEGQKVEGTRIKELGMILNE